MENKSRRGSLSGIVELVLLSMLLMACGERTNKTNLNFTGPLPDVPLPSSSAVPLMGSYNMDLSLNDFSLENLMFRPYLKNYVGDWVLKLDETGNFSASNSNFLFEGLFSVTPDEIVFYGTNWLTSCFNTLKTNEVGYSWHISGKELTLISLEDDCFDRSLVLTAHSWRPFSNGTGATPPVPPNQN